MGLLGALFGGKKSGTSSVAKTNESIEQAVTEEDAVAQATDKSITLQADTLKFDALRAYRLGELEFAIKAFEKAMELRPEFETRFYLVDALIAVNRIDDALSEMELLLQEVPNHRPTLARRANLLLNNDSPERALQDIACALEGEIEEDEERFALIIARVRALDLLGRIEDALAAIDPVLHEAKESGEAQLIKAKLLHKMDRLDEAEASLVLAQEKLPEEERIPLLRGRIALQQGLVQKALDFGNEAIEIDPFNINAPMLIADALCHEDRTQEAIEYLQSAVDEIGQERRLICYLIDLYERTGAGDKAAEWRANLPEEPERTEAQPNSFDNLYTGGIY